MSPWLHIILYRILIEEAGLDKSYQLQYYSPPTFSVFSECNCHGKAEECYFNQTVADLSLSQDIHGQYKGGGVCIGCRDDTAGINCQSCVPGFYRPADVRNLFMRVSLHYLNCCYLNMSAFSTCPGER